MLYTYPCIPVSLDTKFLLRILPALPLQNPYPGDPDILEFIVYTRRKSTISLPTSLP